jgi:hypothetical protein
VIGNEGAIVKTSSEDRAQGLPSPRRHAGSLPRLFLATVVALVGVSPRALSEEPTAGAGDLLVAPPRVVFDARTRTAEVTLVNKGTRAATYRVSFVQLRMDEEGGTKEIQKAEGGELFADGLVRFSPRQVTLEPNVGQTVRLQVRKPADLPPGEYRSHLLFRAIPPSASPKAEDGGSAAPEEGISIQLIPIYGISIPVIVRQGELSAAVTLSDLAFAAPSGTEANPLLYFRMNRTGNQSVYGNLTVTFTPSGGKAKVVGQATGVAVWAPYGGRKVGIPLRPPAGLALSNGVLQVRYSRGDKRDESIAEAALRLP